MKHLVNILFFLFALSASAQTIKPLGSINPLDNNRIAGKLQVDSIVKLIKYASADTNKVLSTDAAGNLVLRNKNAGLGDVTLVQMNDSLLQLYTFIITNYYSNITVDDSLAAVRASLLSVLNNYYNKVGVDSAIASIADTPVLVHRVYIEGQSNAYGLATVNSLLSNPLNNIDFDFFKEMQRVYIADTFGGYSNLKLKYNNNIPRDTTVFGVEMAFAYQWSLTHPTGLLFIDKLGIPGQLISVFTTPTLTSYLVSRRDSSNRWLKAHGMYPVEDGYLWIQGEQNLSDIKAVYRTQLDSVIAQRRHIGIIDYGTRVLFSRISKYSTGYGTGVDSAFLELAATNPYYTTLNNDTLIPDNGSTIHYPPYSILQMGINAFSKIYNADSTAVDTTYKVYVKGSGIVGRAAIFNSTSKITSYPLYWDGTNFGYNGVPNATNAKHNFAGSVYSDQSISSGFDIVATRFLGAGTSSGKAQIGWDATAGVTYTGTAGTAYQGTFSNPNRAWKFTSDIEVGNNVVVAGYINCGPQSTAASIIMQSSGTNRYIYTTGGQPLVLQFNGQITKFGGQLDINGQDIRNVGTLGLTTARATKIWTTDIESTNPPTVSGTALPTKGQNATTSLSAPQPIAGKSINYYDVTALGVNATFSAPNGTASNHDQLRIRILDNGIAHTLGWNAIYRAIKAPLPTTTVAGATMYVDFDYNNADTKWDLIDVTVNTSGIGEANTASNLGGGLANYAAKSGVDLQFNSFAASDFDLASNLFTIDATLKTNWNAAFGWGNHATAGYEAVTNKVTDFTVINNTKYPTTTAVDAYVTSAIGALSAVYAGIGHTHTFASLSSKPTTLSGYGITDAQPLNNAITSISALTPANDDLLQYKAGVWTNRTIAQLEADLSLSGINTGDQTITLTGDVTGSGTGSFATAIGALKITNAMLAGSIAASKLVGTDIATVGTITSGTWNGTLLNPAYGGTGINNGNKTITVSGNTTIGSGTNTVAFTTSGNTNVALPASGTLATLTGTETFTNKTLTTPVISTISNAGNITVPVVTGTLSQYAEANTASSATPAPAGDARSNFFDITALAANATVAAPSGIAANHNTLIIRIKDNGTSRTLTFNSVYRFSTDVTAPAATTISKTMYLAFVYNSADSKWDCVTKIDNY